MPCEISRFLTDQVCRINDYTVKFSSGESKFNFAKITELANTSVGIVKKLLSTENNQEQSSEGGHYKNKHMEKLTSNIENIKSINSENEYKLEILKELRKNQHKNKSQSGGSNKLHYEHSYQYIKNPITNRRVSIYGKTGQKVLKNYINNYK